MSDQRLFQLVKKGEELDEKAKLLTFLTLWPDLAEFCDEIFKCFYQSSSFDDSQNLLTKIKKKEIFKAACESKKVKYIDDPIVAETSQITALRDQQIIQNNKINPDLKAQMKKAKVVETKRQAKLDKTWQKVQEQAHLNDIKRLAIGNR